MEFPWKYRRKLGNHRVFDVPTVIRTGYLRNKSQKPCRLGHFTLWMTKFGENIKKIKLRDRSLRNYVKLKKNVIKGFNLHINGIIT